MAARYGLLLLSIVLAGTVCVVAILNAQPVTINMFSWRGEVAIMLLLFGSLLAGGLLGASVAQMKVSKVVSEKKKLEWDAQDAKLMASVKSDREKQLEAKITTLEAALKTALKNK